MFPEWARNVFIECAWNVPTMAMNVPGMGHECRLNGLRIFLECSRNGP
jgi:hypothetical protein